VCDPAPVLFACIRLQCKDWLHLFLLYVYAVSNFPSHVTVYGTF